MFSRRPSKEDQSRDEVSVDVKGKEGYGYWDRRWGVSANKTRPGKFLRKGPPGERPQSKGRSKEALTRKTPTSQRGAETKKDLGGGPIQILLRSTPTWVFQREGFTRRLPEPETEGTGTRGVKLEGVKLINIRKEKKNKTGEVAVPPEGSHPGRSRKVLSAQEKKK